MEPLHGDGIWLRLAVESDVPALVAIRSTPEVHRRWLGSDLASECREAIESDEVQLLAILEPGSDRVLGAIQWAEEDDPQYRHANLDLYLDPAVHGRGIGSEVVRTLIRFLIAEAGHHRFTIDPAADNSPAIRCYAKAGFREVGVLRRYERGSDGSWHDGLLMELLAEDFTP